MQILTTTLSQMSVLFLLILAGLILVKIKAVPENASVVLSKMENNLFVPALVMGTFMEYFTVNKIYAFIKLFTVSCVLCVIMIVLAIILAKTCTKDLFIRNLYTYGLAFSNFGFMGNAVVKVVFPELFLEYLVFTLPLWCVIYVWGTPCLLIPSEEGNLSFKSRLKAFANPMLIGMLIGMIIGLTGVYIPKPILQVVKVAGDCMSPIAMILTGMIVAKMNFRKVLSIKSIYVVSTIRLILYPAIYLIFFYFWPMDKNIMVCTLCSVAMPLGLSTIVVPSGYGKDTSVAAGMTIVSHVLSCITIPIVFAVMTKLF